MENPVVPEYLQTEWRESADSYDDWLQWLEQQKKDPITVGQQEFFAAAKAVGLEVKENRQAFLKGETSTAIWTHDGAPMHIVWKPWVTKRGQLLHLPQCSMANDSFSNIAETRNLRVTAALTKILKSLPKPVGYHAMMLPDRYKTLFAEAPLSRPVYRLIGGVMFGAQAVHSSESGSIEDVFCTPSPQSIIDMVALDQEMEDAYIVHSGSAPSTYRRVLVIRPSLARRPFPQEKSNHIEHLDRDEWMVTHGTVQQIIPAADFKHVQDSVS